MAARQRLACETADNAGDPTTKRPGRHSSVLAMLFTLAALSSCASSPGDSPPAPPAATPIIANGTASLHLPIEAYMLTPVQSATFDWLRRAATADCMRRYGLDLPVPPRPSTTSPQVSAFSVVNRRYGITDPAAAAAREPAASYATTRQSAAPTLTPARPTTRPSLLTAATKSRTPEHRRAHTVWNVAGTGERAAARRWWDPTGPARERAATVTRTSSSSTRRRRTEPRPSVRAVLSGPSASRRPWTSE